jgi:membrane dipeptidase
MKLHHHLLIFGFILFLLHAPADSHAQAKQLAQVGEKADPSLMEYTPVPVFDIHSDILLRVIANQVDIGSPPEWTQVSIPTMRKGNVTNQAFAVWVNSRTLEGLEATDRALQMLDLWEAQAEKYNDEVGLATTVAEADALNADGKIAIWLWLEGGAPIADDLAILRTFYRLGVRGMTLTWMNNLSWAGSSTDPDNDEMGLTEFGVEVVKEMNRLGMIVDISHVSEATFYDTIKHSSDPIVASHSSCRALCDHPRNLTDDQLRTLAKNGGVIAICALPGYLSDTFDAEWEKTETRLREEVDALKEKYEGKTSNPLYREERRVLIQSNIPEEHLVTLDTYLDHIEHAVKIAGYEHVALGSDFDGIWNFPVGLEKPSQWQNVANGLRERGHSEEVIRAIMHDNTRRVFQQVTGD